MVRSFMTPPMADAARLAESSQRVIVRNTHPEQVHVIIDRHLQGQRLEPGEAREMELLVRDIEFYRHNRTQRWGLNDKGLRELKPVHPVVIEDVPMILPEESKRYSPEPTPQAQAAQARQAQAKAVLQDELVEITPQGPKPAMVDQATQRR